MTVETLIRQQALEAAPAPDGSRHRYVSRASVEAYLSEHPAVVTCTAGPVVPLADARRVLGLTRPVASQLVRSRQLVAVTRARRQCLTLQSIEQYLKGAPRDGALEACSAHVLAPLPQDSGDVPAAALTSKDAAG